MHTAAEFTLRHPVSQPHFLDLPQPNSITQMDTLELQGLEQITGEDRAAQEPSDEAKIAAIKVALGELQKPSSGAG